jgi:hypothetical protein|tara:strand:+ start:421010 stop:421807 length:798 start_codon:yes stop_codon:yes gene_type:complete
MKARITPYLPAALLLIIVLGLAIWYMMSVPAPVMAPTTDTTTSEPAKIAIEEPYYTVEATYPTQTPLVTSAGAQADQEAVASMKAFVEEEIATFIDNGDFANLTHDDIQMLGLDQRKYALGIEYTMYTGVRTVSYVYLIYQDTGGAHPNTNYRTFTFDTKTGSEMKLSDAFIPGTDYLTELSTKVRKELPPLMAARYDVDVSVLDTTYIDSGTTPKTESFQNFYFDGSTFVLLFPPYQVGPYALGMIETPFPAGEVTGLRPEYTQ